MQPLIVPLPHLPFRYTVPGTHLDVVFTAFGRELKDVDVWPTFIDATSFAIDGMVHDGYQPVPAEADLRWRQGGAELSITKTPQLTYNILATSIAAVHDVGMTYGIYATNFQIRAAGQRLGTGQLAFRLAEPSPATNSTATARRDLGDPHDPYWHSVYDTPIMLKFSTYKGALPTPFILDSLVTAIFTAASAIRDNRGDLHIKKAWLWERAVRLTCYPRPDMSWRNLASAVVGMKWFVLREGELGF
ncbi:hypothetical protein G7Y79_00056g090220 [Physcia stellaris]|nr:hypothetical protein G7Y79_00056g090220 [Physcia stellaris]